VVVPLIESEISNANENVPPPEEVNRSPPTKKSRYYHMSEK
jgi:hypothetical protein